MATYGSRLQSILGEQSPGSVAFTPPELLPDNGMQQGQGGAQTFPMGANPAPAMQWEPMGGQAPVSELASAQPAQGSDDFRSHWERTPKAQREQQVDALEKAVGSIDKAYDEMIAQLGARPSGKLSRQDKGMLLMEFGLAMLANSRPGVSAAEAAGVAGSKALGSYRDMTRGRQQAYDSQLAAINAGRAKAKSSLAEKLAVEQAKAIGKAEADERRASELAGTFETADGIYGRTRGGEISALVDPETKERLQPRERASTSEPLVAVLDENGVEIWVPRSEAAGMRKRPPASSSSALSGLKASDSNAIYRQSAGLFGGTFDPITGRIAGLNREESQTVQSIAARASQMYMQAGGKLDHATAVERAFQEVRDGARAPTPSDQPRTFASEDEVADAFQRGEIQKGDVVSINGRQFKVQ